MITVTETEYQSDAESTIDTPYLALTGELWSVFCDYLWENLPRYNETALYFSDRLSAEINGLGWCQVVSRWIPFVDGTNFMKEKHQFSLAIDMNYKCL